MEDKLDKILQIQSRQEKKIDRIYTSLSGDEALGVKGIAEKANEAYKFTKTAKTGGVVVGIAFTGLNALVTFWHKIWH